MPVEGDARSFPVRRVYCVGRNYAAHAREMGHDPDREPPFFFQKNPDSLIPGGGDFPYPAKSADVHHEFEMVVALGRGGTDIPVERALDCVYGYAVGFDMTRRDLQAEAKKLAQLDPMVRNSAVAYLSGLRFDELRGMPIAELQEALERVLFDDFASKKLAAPFVHVLVSKLIVQ